MSHPPVQGPTAIRSTRELTSPMPQPTSRLPGVVTASSGAEPSADAAVAIGRDEPGGAMIITSYARITMDPETRIISISIVDSTTDEVIRQVPPEEVVALARAMQAHAKQLGRGGRHDPAGGQVVDRKV